MAAGGEQSLRDPREVKAVAAGAAAVSIYMALVLASGLVPLTDFARLLAFYLETSFTLWAGLGIGWAMIRIYANRPRGGGTAPSPFRVLAGAARERWDRDYLLSLVWPPLLFAVLIASFNAFKQMILPLAGYGLDPLFAGMDRALLFGTDPWRATHALFGSPAATLFIDRSYHGWFAPMSLGLILCAWLPASTWRLRTQYMLSYIGVWIGIGSLLAFSLPSAGPCFYPALVGDAPEFEALLRRLAEIETTTGANLTALHSQAMLLAARSSDQLLVGGGISAMPSVHNALAVLVALGAYRLNKAAGWLLAAYALLIWIGSIHLGWHYAIDGIAAAALTLAIWRLCGRLADRLEQPASVPGTQPALA